MLCGPFYDISMLLTFDPETDFFHDGESVIAVFDEIDLSSCLHLSNSDLSWECRPLSFIPLNMVVKHDKNMLD